MAVTTNGSSVEFELINTLESRRSAAVDELSKGSMGYRPGPVGARAIGGMRKTQWRQEKSNARLREQPIIRHEKLSSGTRARIARCPFATGQRQWANKGSGSHSILHTHSQAFMYLCIFSAIGHAVGHKLWLGCIGCASPRPMRRDATRRNATRRLKLMAFWDRFMLLTQDTRQL